MRALSTIAKGDSSHITERQRVVVKSPGEWAALWAAHAGPASEAPTVNFASALVAAAFAGRQPTPCNSIDIVGAIEEEGGTRLVVEERTSASDPEATMAMSKGSDPDGTMAVPKDVNPAASASPFHIVMLPPVEGEIRWTDATHTRRAEAADPSARIARGAHSRTSATGLRPRTAGVLSYLAGPVSGVIMLVAEPEQPFVRFHAWQSVIALGAFGAAVIVCYLVALASLFFTANGLAIMVRVAAGVWIALLLLWAALMWQAWQGRAWKLPIAGDWAERLAAPKIGPRPASR
jgi:uncharacterized membrane protein